MAAFGCSPTSQAIAGADQQVDQIQKLGLDASQMHRFGGILRNMNIGAIPTYASKIRHFGHHTTPIVSSDRICDSGMLACNVVGFPLCGSFHIVFTLEFDDGVKWMLKISANGHRFDSVAAAALTSEARTMQLLKSSTTIPVPAVYAFDASACNDLNTPFILMERIDGKPLYQGWFDDEIPKARLEHFRVNALQSLAEAMTQLNRFTLDRGGALEFDSTGKSIGLRGAKVVDVVSMYKRGASSGGMSDVGQNNTNNHDHEELQGAENKNDVDDGKESKKDDKHEDDDDDDEDIFCEKGPFDSPISAFLFDLDRSDAYCKSDVYTKGCYKALRMFIDLAFANHDDHGKRFVLTHPDLDIQNVLVAEDGTLRGLIDWDGVAFVSREIGCAQYPLWLMRDWVPYFYLYDIRAGKTEDDAGYEESSPAELASYRALYAHFMEKEIERHTGGSDQATTFGTLPKQEAQLTRRSLVMRDLDLAASSPFLTTNILSHIVYQIEKVTEPDWGDMEIDMDSVSSTSSRDAADSDCDINRDTNSEVGEGDPETDATENDDVISNPVTTTARIKRADQEAATLDHTLSHGMANVSESSSKVPPHDQGSGESSKSCDVETEELSIKPVTNADPKVKAPSKSTTMGWGRKLLCFGCNAAGKGLRRIAKFGHVLEDAIEDVAEVLAEVEIQQHGHAQHAIGEESELAMGSRSNRGMGEVEHSEATEKKRPEDVYSTRLTVAPAQPQEMPPVDATVELQGALPNEETTRPDQINEVASNQPTLTLLDVPARKAALIEAEKARQKANHCTDKAMIKEELKIWENIALAVWYRGVSLDQLRMSQGKIARWVVDTLQNEKEHEDDPVVEPVSPPMAKATEQGAMSSKEGLGSSATTPSTPGPQISVYPTQNSRTSKHHRVRKEKDKLLSANKDKKPPGLGTENSPVSETSTRTTIPDVPSPANYPDIQVNAEKPADRLVLGPKNMHMDSEGTGISAKVTLTSSSRPPFALPDPLRSNKISSPLGNYYSSQKSGIRMIASSPTKCGDDKDTQTLLGSVIGSDDGHSDRSNTSESCKSSATSVSDGGEEDREDTKAKEDDVFGLEAISTAENHGGENDRNGANDAGEKSEMIGNLEEGEMVDLKPADDGEGGLEATNKVNAQDGETDDDQSDSASGGGDSEDGVGTFDDDGEFRSQNIFMLLGMDMLDELRLLRLQEGFLKLLEQY